MEAATSRLSRARSRARSISPSAFRRLAAVALGSLFVVVATGAVVRLTASGLGCDNWPRCGNTPFPEKDFHALVEFGNRVVALGAMVCTTIAAIAARRVARLPGWIRWGTVAVAASVVAQIPLGGLTVIFDLHPILVMSHFLLAFGAVGLATAVLVGADGFARGHPAGTVPAWLPWLALALLPPALVLVVTGAFVTAAGPHSGGSDIERLGNVLDAVYVHVRATAVFGVGFLLLGFALFRHRAQVRGELLLAAGVLGILLLQMAVGEIQWRNGLPWGLVLVHVALASAVWAGVVAVAVRLWSHPRTETSQPASHPRAFSN
jgi:cytochrome c oxidase assembly protein subunit 15